MRPDGLSFAVLPRSFNAGSIEYSIWDDLMTEEGELWQPTEEDTTLSRCRGHQTSTW